MNNKFKVSGNKILFLIFLFIVLLLTIFMIVGSKEHVQFDFIIVTTFAINICLFMFKLISAANNHPFSFDMMFWLFNLFFFGAAPLLQYLTNTYAWGLVPTGEEVLRVNLLVSIWSVMYMVGRKVIVGNYYNFTASSTKTCEVQQKQHSEYEYRIRNNALNVLLLISVLITVYNVIFVGLENLFFRETSTEDGQSQIMFLITVNVFKNIQLFTAVLFLLRAKSRWKIDFRTVIALVCFLISCFPTGLSRYMAASFYAGLMIIVLEKSRKGRWFSLVILGGLVLVFPALNIFRYANNMSDMDIIHTLKVAFENAYLEGHYDAHQMIISIHRYTQQIGYEFFGQIIGALFFFVPRSIWPSKPVGTGHTVISGLDQYFFTNVSAPLMGEFYIGFGVIGIILGAIFLGLLLKKLDNKYWRENNPLSTIRIVYPFSIFMFFFMERGDMLSSWAYLCAQAVIGFAISKFAIKRVRIRKEL